MKILFKICILLIMLVTFSCDKTYYVNCDTCYQTEPVRCNLELVIGTSFGSQPDFEITVYFGKLEDGVVIDSFSTYSNYTLEVLVNNFYTIVATTEIEGKEYRVVDSIKPETELIVGSCDEDCYIVNNDQVNLRLKYY